jgi:hypothetical protein
LSSIEIFKSKHFVISVAQFAGEWNVIAYVPNASFGEKKCAKMTIAGEKTDAGFTRTYKFEYFDDGKVKTGEGISYSKGETKGAMSYSVYKKDEETKFSRKFPSSAKLLPISLCILS